MSKTRLRPQVFRLIFPDSSLLRDCSRDCNAARPAATIRKSRTLVNIDSRIVGKPEVILSMSLAGQSVGVKEVDDGIWLASFMDYDLGYIDLKNLAAIGEPLRAEKCNPCLRNVLLPTSRNGQFITLKNGTHRKPARSQLKTRNDGTLEG